MQDWKMQDRKMQDKMISIFWCYVLYRDLIIVSTSLYISVASEVLMLRTCRLAHLCVCLFVCLSVCLSVCLESVLWQNG